MLPILFCSGRQIHETIEYINQLKTERDFMLSFSNNPQDFIQDWLKSQSRDLKVDVILFSVHFTGLVQQHVLKWFCGNVAHRSLTDLLILWGDCQLHKGLKWLLSLSFTPVCEPFPLFFFFFPNNFNIYTNVLEPWR